MSLNGEQITPSLVILVRKRVTYALLDSKDSQCHRGM